MSDTRRYFQGDPAKQPQDCGRKHPQPLCMCVLCEIAARFANIARLQKHRELLRAIREIDATPDNAPRQRADPGDEA